MAGSPKKTVTPAKKTPTKKPKKKPFFGSAQVIEAMRKRQALLKSI